MSRRKERKIRNLKRKVIWPRVLGMIFTDFIILGCTGFLSYLAILGIIDTLILNNTKDVDKIVQTVNQEWNKNSNEVLKEKIITLENAFDSIQEVYLVNSNMDVIETFDKPIPDFEESGLRYKKNNKFLERKEYFRSQLQEDIQNDFIITGKKSLERVGSTFAPALNFIRFAKDRALINWAGVIVDAESQWVIIQTNIPDVNVCVKSVFLINNFHAYFAGFLILIFVCVFLLCLSYEIIRLISFIADATKLDAVLSTDMVTGGKNKDWFVGKAQRSIKHSKRSYALVQIRMEKYRNYCTSYGVKQGENLLELFSNALDRITDKKEISAHIEKSDFALLLNYDNEEQLNDRLIYIVNNLAAVRKNQHLTFVSGIAKVNSKNDDINALLTASSLAINSAEESNVNIVWFNDSMKEEQVWERRIEDDMEKALANHEFQLYLQPKYSTKGEKLAAAEALVRWIHPVLGFISPGKFIPIFESNGFILKLDDYMLTAVAKQQAKWMAEGKELVPISVNVSRAHFTKDDLAEHICQIVDEYKVPHKYIELELTESAFFDDKAILLNTVKKLKGYGFAVSMDDFGAGYSSLNSLKELPLDVIKLDAEFFRGIDDINRANLIVGDTISLAKKLGMQIVAEGIETREQVDFLANQDCDLIQGFYFAKPLPINEFEERAYPEDKKDETGTNS